MKFSRQQKEEIRTILIKWIGSGAVAGTTAGLAIGSILNDLVASTGFGAGIGMGLGAAGAVITLQ